LFYANFGIYAADSIAVFWRGALIVLSVSYQPGKSAVNVLFYSSPDSLYNEISSIIGTLPEVSHFYNLK
jgi:hypothetical protein